MSTPTKHPIKSIAVLPFRNRSASDEYEYFSDGITEEIINALARIEGLKVTSRTSSFYFKNKDLPLAEIGRLLNVTTVLEGSVRLSSKKIRLTVRLIDTREDAQLWTQRIDRPLADLFAVQDEISVLVADQLREHLGHLEIADQLIDRPNLPISVYQKYLESRYHILKMSNASIQRGIRLAREVVKLAPDFAPAHLAIHLGYTMLGTIGFLPAAEAFQEGGPYLESAIALNPALPECQLNLSYVTFLQGWDLSSTYRHLQRSLEIRPTVEYYQSMASTLVAEAKYSAALHYLSTAIQLDPFSAINYHLQGFVYYCQEQYTAAIEQFAKSNRLQPSFMPSLLYRGQALLLAGRREEALSLFRALPDEEGQDLVKRGGMALVHAALGESAAAQPHLAALQAATQTDLMGRALNLLMLYHATLGDDVNCCELIEQGIASRLPLLVYLPVEPMLKPLRTNGRFQSLMRKILGTSPAVQPPKRKYKKALFSTRTLKQSRERLIELMETKAPYLDPTLTLRQLAGTLDLPPNHLSQLLNEGFDKNFAEFVNAYRLAAFKSKVTDPAQRQLTILALAYDSGFNSKTVFNTFFKKMEGKTPRQYWREVVEEKRSDS